MLDTVKQLLILQDRDRKLLQIRTELDGFEMQRKVMQSRSTQSQSALETVKLKLKQIETDRKKLELEVDAKKLLIERYSLQQFQTKKNEEYRALTHEIELCKTAINEFEDRELELMEQADQVQKELAAATRQAHEVLAMVTNQLGQLATREVNLKASLEQLSAERASLVVGVEEGIRSRYERLLKQRGDKVLVGIEHGVCSGCHMKLPPQTLISCQSDDEITNCPNCGRILFYTPEMDLSNPEF
jgi:uncharacterized protein